MDDYDGISDHGLAHLNECICYALIRENANVLNASPHVPRLQG
jgi:hypothetical protein